MEAHSYVHVKANVPAAHKAQAVFASTAEMDCICKDLDMRLSNMSNVVQKLGDSVSPWGISKNAKRAAEVSEQLNITIPVIKSVLLATLKESKQAAEDLAQARSQLSDKEESIVRLQASHDNLKQRVEEQDAQLLGQAQQIKELLAKVDGGESAKVQARAEAGGRFDAKEVKVTKEAKVQQLGGKVEAMLNENKELQAANEALTKAKAQADKKLKELSDKLRDEVEIRDREIRKLQTELKKAQEAKEAGVKAAKEEASAQVASRGSELKALQRRVECAKTEAEQAKAAQKSLKAQLEEATSALAKSQDEAKALGRKLSDMKLAKEDLARDLEMAQKEQAMVHAEYVSAARPAGAASVASTSRAFYNAQAPWPRVAFTTRGGKCLHNKACGAVDINKCCPLEYHSHKELEAVMADTGMLLCHSCRAENGF